MKQIIASIKAISYVSAVPAIWFGRHIRSILWYYAWASLSCDIASWIIREYLGHSTRITSNIFHLLEPILIGIYFSWELFSGWVRLLFLLITAAITIRFAVHVIGDLHSNVNWADTALGMALFTIFCVVALYKVIRNIEHLKIKHSPLFVFSAAFLLYASYSLVLMLFADHFRASSPELREELWSIHNALNVVKNLAIARMFFLQQKAHTS